MMFRLFLAAVGVMRIRKRSPAAGSSIQQLVMTQAKRLGLRFVPLVKLPSDVGVPMLVGTLRPFLLLPASLITGLKDEELENVVLHELAHLRRFDHYTVAVQRVVESVLFFHPVVWYLSRRIDVERENCCDDLVISSGIKADVYAKTALTNVRSKVPVLIRSR